MGGLISSLWGRIADLWGGKEIKILIVGLDNAGKVSGEREGDGYFPLFSHMFVSCDRRRHFINCMFSSFNIDEL